MSANFNINDFSALARKLLEKCENGEEFLLGSVHQQMRQAYNKFPEDAVIRSVASVIERMAEKNPPSTIINQKQLSSIYNDLVRLTGDSKFKMVLGHLLLPVSETRKVATNLRDDRLPIEAKDLIDPKVKDVLARTFDEDLASKVLNKELADKGVHYVRAELKSIGFGLCTIKVAGGDAKRVFYGVAFDTVKGPVSVYVPANVEGGKFRMPTTFIDDTGEKELKADVLGESLLRRSAKIEDVGGGIKRAENDLPELVVPEVEMPKELAHLTRDFENTLLETTSAFGREAVAAGKKVVATELRAAGFKNAQVKFGSDSNEAVIYLASISTPHGTATVEVPIEMKATIDDRFVPMMPSCFAYNEQINDFTAANLQKFATEAITTSESNSLYSFMVLGELKEELIKCASINNYTACEDILNHIGATFSEEDHRNAIADYQYVLSIKSKAAENQTQAAEIAKQAGAMIPAGKGSIYARLPNGQPIKDMIKDENGRYRSATEIVKEKLNAEEDGGASINTSSILFS